MKNTSHKSVLLFGATGLIGSELGKQLVQQGVHVHAALRQPEDEIRLAFKPAAIHVIDFHQPASLQQAMKDVDYVLYFAAFSIPAQSPLDPVNEFTHTLPALRHTLEAMKGKRPHFIFPSSGGAIYGEIKGAANETSPLHATSSYALGKILSEQLIHFYSANHQIPFTILRFANVYGSTQKRLLPQGIIDRFLDNTLQGKSSPIWGDVNITRDFLHASDAAKAVIAVLNNADNGLNQTFNIASGQSHSIKDVLDIIHEVTDGKHTYENMQENFAGIKSCQLSNDKFRKAYPAWECKLDLREGIKQTWNGKIIPH